MTLDPLTLETGYYFPCSQIFQFLKFVFNCLMLSGNSLLLIYFIILWLLPHIMLRSQRCLSNKLLFLKEMFFYIKLQELKNKHCPYLYIENSFSQISSMF